MKKILLLTAILLLVLLTSCLPSTPTKVPTVNEPIVEEISTPQTEVNMAVQGQISDPYPEPQAESEAEPYVGPEEPTAVPYVFRVSKEGTATIHGILAVVDPEQAMPDPNDSIFMVPLPESDGVTMIPTFEIGTVPQADVDERTGEFVFTDIEPGQYIVMVYTLGNAQIPARNYEGGFAILKITEEDRDQIIEVNYLRVP